MSAAARESVDTEILANLSPLNTMDADHFNEVASRAKIKQFKKGEYLFREGHSDRHTFYVIKGRIALLSQASEVKTIDGGNEEANNPIAPDLPRKFTARVQSTATVVMIDTTVLDFHLGKHDAETYEVNDIDEGGEGDWMTKVLQSQAFSKLPPINLQRMLSGVTEVPYQSGEVVIHEGQQTDHYFIVKSGVCCDANVLTQEWRCGDAFGASGLMLESGQPSSIIMKSSGELMLLPKEDFIELCYTPLVQNTNTNDVRPHIENGAKWLDLRSQSSRVGSCLVNSTYIPFPDLLEKVVNLNNFQAYIVVGDSPVQAGVGAFLLMQHGLNAYCYNDETSNLDVDFIDADASPEMVDDISAAPNSELQLKQELEVEKQRLMQDMESLKSQEVPSFSSGLGEGLSLVDDDSFIQTSTPTPPPAEVPTNSTAAPSSSAGVSQADDQKVQELNAANAELSKKIAWFETQLSNVNKQLSGETERRKLAEANYTNFLKKVKRYKRGNDALVKKLKTQLIEGKNKLTHLLEQSASVDTDINQARAQIEEKVTALAAAEEKLVKEQERVSELETTVTDLRNELDHVGQEFSSSDDADKVKLLQEKIKTSAEEKRALEEELKVLREDYEALENERAEAALWDEMEDLQNALDSDYKPAADDLSDLTDLLDDGASDDLNDLDFD